MGGVGIAGQVVEVDLAGLEQLVDQRADEQPVGAGADAHPFIGNGRIAGLDRVDRNNLCAVLLQLAKPGLDRVGGMILGHAEQHEVFRVVPVGLAELPERAAKGVDAGRRHVDRAEAAVRCEVGGAELRRPPAGERLRLVAAGEQGKLPRIAHANLRQPGGGSPERFFPLHLAELAGAARPHAHQRLGEACRRIVLHDAGRALAAQHALVDRVVAVALDVFDRAVLEVHLDAAAAGAHVAGRGLHLVPGLEVEVDLGLVRHEVSVSALSCNAAKLTDPPRTAIAPATRKRLTSWHF